MKLGKILIIAGVFIALLYGATHPYIFIRNKESKLAEVINQTNTNTQEEEVIQQEEFFGSDYITIDSLKEYDIHYKINDETGNIVLTRGSDLKSCIVTIGTDVIVTDGSSNGFTMSLPVVKNDEGIWVPKEDMDNYFNFDAGKIEASVKEVPAVLVATYNHLSEVIKTFAELVDTLSNDGHMVVAISTSNILGKQEYLDLYNEYFEVLDELSAIDDTESEEINVIKQCMLSNVIHMVKVHDAYKAGVSTDIAENKENVVIQWERLNKLVNTTE